MKGKKPRCSHDAPVLQVHLWNLRQAQVEQEQEQGGYSQQRGPHQLSRCFPVGQDAASQ